MSLNTAHANNGVLIHAGEAILLFSENVNMEFSGQDAAVFKGTKLGKIYLTTHRMIYNAKNSSDVMQSFSFPFVCLTDVELEQPVFGANFIKGKVRAQDNGQFVGEAKFKLLFKAGGAIDFAQAMLRAAHMAKSNSNNAPPPPYFPPTGSWHEAPPPAYSPNPQGYYGWLPNTQAFPNGPPPNSVFMYDNPPPYPGIVPPQAHIYPNVPQAGGYGGYPSQPGYPPQSAGPGYPPQPSQPGYPPQSSGPGYPSQPSQPGYPPQSSGPGYPPQPSQPGYPPQPSAGAGYPPQTSGSGSYPQWGNPGALPNGYAGYPAGPPSYTPGGSHSAGGYGQPQTTASGFKPQPNSKEQEAAQSAYNPQPPQPYAPPPPAYYEPPPNYNSLGFKKD